jgi:hypothetical protein
MPGIHSSLGASKAHRYRACPGSVAACRDLPDSSGEEAAQGTVFHEVAADVLQFGLNPHHFVGHEIEVEGFGFLPFTEEMAVKMQTGLDLVWAFADAPSAKLIVEQRLDLSRWLGPDQFGTSDACVIDPQNRLIVVFDWKWGAGVPVDPCENDQAVLYALGVWDRFERDFDGIEHDKITVKIIIEQPRAAGGGGIWDTTVEWLLLEGEKIRRDAELTRDPNAPRIPGVKQCKFCPAARFKTCREYVQFNLDMVGQKFEDLDEAFSVGAALVPPDVKALTPQQRSQILLNESMFRAFLKDLHEEALNDAIAGRDVPGMKLVDGRSPPRRWKDEEKAGVILRKKLGKAAEIVSLKSPAMIEETVGKTAFEKDFGLLVDVGKPKPVLVPEHDKRQARPNIHDKFDNLDDI